jgi:arylsulfatase
MDDKLPSGDPGAGYQGTIGRTLQESSPWWPPRPEARAGSPDIVVVLLDDLGFSDVGCFGAEIATPNIDALAANGLRFSQYTTVPMCTPARAALLTGKNPHAVGCGWLTFNLPGYPGYQAGEISRDAPTLAELLRGSGYATYCAGKWHNTADFDVSASASRASWPLARGFDRFYGFIGGETHYFSPFQLFEDNAIVDRDAYASDYYCTDDWTDKAVAWLTSHVSSSRDKPFFLYLPYNAPHAPLQAKPSDLVRYRGVYDRGWDELRDARRERQQAMRLFAREWPVAPRSPGVPAWAELPAERRALYARYMELYAAIVDNVDQNVGRVVACLQKLGRLDNTLVIVTSDNGANGIGGVEGAVNNLAKRLTGREDPERVRDVMASGRLGATETWPAYPLGWTDVSSAPFRLYKTTTMNGGIRVPFVAHWPRGIAERGAIRQQWLHVTDIVPTILDIVGQPYPEALNGYRTRSLDGVSAKALFRRANATSARSRQHYELAGNRGYIENGWKIVSLQPPGRAIDLDNWMLFDLECDATEVHDLARAHPDKLAELVAAFDADAQANYVYPLDNRGVRRSLTVPPFLEGAYARPHTFHPGSTIALGVVAPLVNDRDYRLACTFEFEPGDEGVLFALGDLLGGLALFARGDALVFVYRSGQGGEVASDALRVRAGTNRFELRHEALGARRGRGTLVVNDERVATVDMSPTTILGLGVGEGLDIGVDRKLPVTERYEGNGAWPYTGRVACVTIEPGTHPADSYANLPEREAQRQP